MTDQKPPAEAAQTRVNGAGQPGRPLKVGINLPTVEGTMGGSTASWADLFAFVRQAEALGFDSLWVPDHLLPEKG